MKEVEFKDIKLHHWYWFEWQDDQGNKHFWNREVIKHSKDHVVIRKVIKGNLCGGSQVHLVSKDQIKTIYQ